MIGKFRGMIRHQIDTKSDGVSTESKSDVNVDGSSFIDVWWLIDDGGLTVLLPYLMKLHAFWSECHLRLNIIAGAGNEMEVLNVYHLMNEFRLPFDKPNVIEVDAKHEEPEPATMRRFQELASDGAEIDFERDLIRPKVIRKWLKVSELVHEHSSQARAIVLTLPLPTRFYRYQGDADKEDQDKDAEKEKEKQNDDKQYMNARVYFSVLEMLTEKLPPTILVRGNGQSALTFYSE